MQVIFHADDFGIDPVQSTRILDCCGGAGAPGLLNSLSIFANSLRFDECAELLERKLASLSGRPDAQQLLIGLHVNLVEGHCVADPAQVPMLVDGDGMFDLGFLGLLKKSRSRQRAEAQRQIEIEIDAQLAKLVRRFPQMRDGLRVDSHQHTHAIPVVFDALLASIERSGCKLEHMRVPVESRQPFAPKQIAKRIRKVNLAKHKLLAHLWKQDAKAHPEAAAPASAFCGVLFSGEMTAANVEAVFDGLARDAAARELDLEVLFHPGIVDEAALCLNPALPGFVEFSTSPNRELEAQALKAFALESRDGLPALTRIAPDAAEATQDQEPSSL